MTRRASEEIQGHRCCLPSILVLLLTVGLLWFTGGVESQVFKARLFDGADGLGNVSVTAFAQSPDGHLWVATEDGVFRYDGSVFTEFGSPAGLTDPSVYSLLIDSTGTLWAGSHGGLFRFDGQMFHEVRVGTKSMRIGVNSMLASAPGHELVAETSTGLVSVERTSGNGEWMALPYRSRHPAFPDSGDTDGIAVDRTGTLWFGDGGKLCSFKGEAVRVYGPAQGVPQDFYVSIFAARNGQVWARGRKHILTLLPGSAAVTELTAGLPEGAMITVNRRFTEDAAGRILTPTSRGFATWDGQSWEETTTTSAGPVEGATDLFADREGSIWIGTDGGGLLHSLGYELVDSYSGEAGLGGSAVRSLAFDHQGRLWLGDSLGASIFSAGKNRMESVPLGGPTEASYIEAFAPDPQGGMWAAALQGHIFHVSPRGRVDLSLFLDAYIRRLRLDREGVLWIVTSKGLYTLHPGKGTPVPQPFTAGGLGEAGVEDAVLAPDGSLWVTSRKGLDHIEKGRVTHLAVPQQPAGLGFLCLDRDGTLWLSGRSSGVLHLRAGQHSLHVLATYARPQLTSDLIRFLDVDTAGRVWLGTDHGVDVIRGGKVFHITNEDGLLRDDTGSIVITPPPDGSVWIGTGKGVSHVRDPDGVLERPPFSAAIEEAQYGRHAVLGGGALAWDRASLDIRYSALTFRDSHKIVFHTRLLGFDTSETVSKSPAMRYPQLPPGSYRFRVYAEDTGTGAVSAPLELRFALQPPWWRTSWAKALLVALFLGSIAGLWYALHLALLAQRRRLEGMVQERTLELQRQANHDALTGLLNRRALFNALTAEIDRASRRGSELCVAIIDLDHFKRINDTFGHLAGDEILREAAKRLASVSRSSGTRNADVVGRYGGEEFLVIFKDAKYTLGLERCESIRRAMCEQAMRYEKEEITVTCSIGLAFTRRPAEPVAQLLAEADRALYCAKSKGRNLVQGTDAMEVLSM